MSVPLVSRITIAFSNPFPLTAVTMSDGSFMSSFLRILPIFSAFSARFSSSKTCVKREITQMLRLPFLGCSLEGNVDVKQRKNVIR